MVRKTTLNRPKWQREDVGDEIHFNHYIKYYYSIAIDASEF